MDQNTATNEIELRCLHGREAPCSSACPFPLNVRDFLAKIKKGSFHGAFNLYREAVGFPDLVWRICPAPCKSACLAALEKAVDMPALEQAALAYARSTAPIQYNLPPKGGRIAIVGAGLSGLSCARRLSVLNYSVSVFEKQDRICPGLEGLLPREIFEPALMGEFRFTTCEFFTGRPVESLAELDFDAVYLSSGVALEGGGAHVFRSPEGLSPVEALAEGARVADALEWYLKTGRKKPLQAERSGNTAPPAASGREVLSKAEARQEADRCTRCDCSACMQECMLMRQYGQTPKDLSKDVGLALNVFPETQGRAGMREIGACNFCGLCKKICPSQIDIGAFLLRSRTELCSKGLLPPAHHEFWLRDMAFSNGSQAAYFYRPQPSCGYLFFPGCQSGGSDPRYVTMTYEKLLARDPGTALLLRCCGAPALWAGEAEAFRREHAVIRGFWERAGRPVVLLSCPSCYRVFREYMPDIPVKIVYELLEMEVQAGTMEEAAVFDPCSSRDFPEIRAAVRNLAVQSGVRLEELPYAGEKAQCCSWGGHGYAVNPVVVKAQAREQAEQSALPYITYCTNCRDIFSDRGKNCRHILDMVNGINNGFRRPPTATERRNNRRALKRALLAAYPTEDAEEMEECAMLQLVMEDQVAARMSEDLILEEDLAQAIETCEKERKYLMDPESGRRVCHLKIGYITYWAEYAPREDGARVVYHAYSHRMTIKEEYGAEG